MTNHFKTFGLRLAFEPFWIEMTRHLSLILRSGVGVYHRAALCADPLAASRRVGLYVFSWFETAQERLLTMRSGSHQAKMTLIDRAGEMS